MNYAALVGMAIFMLMFGVWWGLAAWTVHVVLYIFLNSSVNSVCHMVGCRNFDDKATNLQSIAFLTAGEGLHTSTRPRRGSRCAAAKSTPRGPSFACWKSASSPKCGSFPSSKPPRSVAGPDPARGRAMRSFSCSIR
jgi:hypothetical protein